MDRAKLDQYLWNSATRLYCILDGAAIHDLPGRLYKTQTPNACLFSGDLEPDMVHVAPYVVLLTPGNVFTDQVFSNSLGENAGIFVHSRHSIREMRRHFSSLINVYDENANSFVFRFYDPRVIRQFLPTCNADELKTFFGKVESFFAETADGSGLIRYQVANDKLKQTDLN